MTSARLPKHLAIIMDGNGRWAELHALPRLEGHRRGMEVSEDMITACKDRGISYLTLYAFSEENWGRPDDEVEGLMQALEGYLRHKREKMIREGIRFRTIGDTNRLPASVQREIASTTEATAKGRGMTLILALSYGGRQEICRAVNALVNKGVTEVTPDDLDAALDTKGIPDVDLLIRTSGEYRVSNFLLWQIAYAELYFTETLWPDFGKKDLDAALAEYASRERRFGMTSHQLRRVAP